MDRSTTRTARTDRRPDARRVSVREFPGALGYRVEFDVRTVYDFVLGLVVQADEADALLPEDRRWLTEARASLPEEVREAARTIFEEAAGGMGVHVLVGVVDHPEATDAAAFLQMIDGVPARTIVGWVIDELLQDATLGPLVKLTLDGEIDLLPKIEALVADRYGKTVQLEILRDPDRWVERMRAVLHAWAERFAPQEDRIRAMLARDVDGREANRATLPSGELIERTTGGIRYLADSGVRRVILAPAYFPRPYNFVFTAGNWRLFCYPIADAALGSADPLAPPLATVRLHRALGDDTRLRILKLLAGRDQYLTELAQQLELSKPTVKHHLAQLRAAGLVTVTEEGTLIYYSLRRERLEEGGVELRRYLSE